MGKLVVLVAVISILATACSWRECVKATAYGIGSTAVLLTGNADGFGTNENIGGQAAADLVDTLFDAANNTSPTP